MRPAQQWTDLSNALGITDLGKEPPAVCHPERDLVEGGVLQRLVDHKHTTHVEQLAAVTQRVAHERRRVQAIS